MAVQGQSVDVEDEYLGKKSWMGQKLDREKEKKRSDVQDIPCLGREVLTWRWSAWSRVVLERTKKEYLVTGSRNALACWPPPSPDSPGGPQDPHHPKQSSQSDITNLVAVFLFGKARRMPFLHQRHSFAQASLHYGTT